MNKKVFGKKLSRDSTSRRALYRTLVRSFVVNNKLVTTYTKARVVLPIIENLFVRAKRNSISDRRFIYAFTGNDRIITDKLFDLVKRAGVVGGGLLKYVNLPARKGDNAPVVRIEFARKVEQNPVAKIDAKKAVLKPGRTGIFKKKTVDKDKKKNSVEKKSGKTDKK